MSAQQDVKKFVEYVISGLDNKYTLPSCSKAFSALCIDNAEVLSVFAPEIIQNSTLFSINLVSNSDASN